MGQTKFHGRLFLWILAAGVMFAQEYRGRVQGLVTDPSNAPVVNARVVLRNQGTGVEATRETDASGKYRFDFVLPGSYTVSAEMAGFSKASVEGVAVLTAGDVTVDLGLKIGNVSETVNVEAEAAHVEFNTSTMTTTVQGQLLKDVPVLARNPFTLALLNPAVVNRYWDVAHRNPFYMWSSQGLDVGGSTGGKNDLLLDGVPLGYAARGGYNAPMDAVQEVSVQQNSVDSEFGFSAGGTLNISMKSGTNEFHGNAYFFGRNPYFNAMTNRITREPSVVRNNVWGGTIGNPIKKNKVFSYFSYEQWRSTQPASSTATLPTDAERTGNFSGARTPSGALRMIYDPVTTTLGTDGGVTRMPFPGNIIPQNRINPTGAKILGDLWKPNNAGQDASGINNYLKTYSWWIKYYNISERVDWNISDKLRMYARFSKYETRLDNPNHGGTIAVRSDNGGLMDALNAAADVLYMMTPSTTLNIRYGATYVEDDYDSQWAKVPESVWSGLFPTNWQKNVLSALPGIYYPNFSFSGNGGVSTGIGSWWLVRGRVHSPQVSVTHDKGKHHLKAGWQLRYSYDGNGLPGPGGFGFSFVDTAASYINANAKETGNMFASALLGYPSSGNGAINPMFFSNYQQWGMFLQDDIKVNRNVTLNLGLRWETENAPAEDNRIFSRFLDLNNPIPEFQGANTPRMPAGVTALGNVAYKYNGAWNFTDDQNPRIYPSKSNFLPRVGLAIRLSDNSALRFGWARYAVPFKGAWTEGFSLPRDGYSESTSILPPVQGVPQTVISDPFPAANPFRDPVGRGRERYTNLGNSAGWFFQDLKRPINDRINVSFQKMAPLGIVTDTTFFMNFGHNILPHSMWGGEYGRPLNMMDPEIGYRGGAATTQAVDNPFFGLLDAQKFPGVLRNQRQVPASRLLVPYPQYGTLTERLTDGYFNRYYALQFKAERRFANGLSFLLGYNYNQEKRAEFFNEVDRYKNAFTLIDTREARHNIRLAGTADLPFGRGRKFLSNIPRSLDLLIGGWSTSSLYMFNNGRLLTFGQLKVNGDPKISNPGPGGWFNTSVFSRPDAFTPRTNPWYYDGVRGPGFFSLDSTLVKYINLTERKRLEFRFEFFNTTNSFIASDPVMAVDNGNFGKSTWIAGGNYGREVQYMIRFHF